MLVAFDMFGTLAGNASELTQRARTGPPRSPSRGAESSSSTCSASRPWASSPSSQTSPGGAWPARWPSRGRSLTRLTGGKPCTAGRVSTRGRREPSGGWLDAGCLRGLGLRGRAADELDLAGVPPARSVRGITAAQVVARGGPYRHRGCPPVRGRCESAPTRRFMRGVGGRAGAGWWRGRAAGWSGWRWPCPHGGCGRRWSGAAAA